MSNTLPRQATPTAHDHFYALDAIRGVAAVLVVCLHEFQSFAGVPHPFSGYLAVDLFFLLSGYVIASAYDRRLASGMPFGTFLKLRLIRLYPLYLVGFLIGLARVLVQFQVGVNPPPAVPFAWGSVMELLMLPTPMTIGWQYDTLFFLNPPAWSLFFELLINIAFAAIHRHLSQRVLVVLILVSGLGLIYVADANRSLEVGNYWHTMATCAPRVAFPFLMGVWIFRHGPRLPRLSSAWAWPLTLMVVPLLAWHPLGYQDMYDLVLVMGVFPLIVWLGSAVRTHGLTTSASKIAGEVSYAIYIVHMPLFGLLLAVLRRVAPDWTKQPYSGPLAILLVALFCLALDHFYDKPVRKWLARTLAPRPITSSPGTVGSP